jgi:hypothetical protein
MAVSRWVAGLLSIIICFVMTSGSILLAEDERPDEKKPQSEHLVEESSSDSGAHVEAVDQDASAHDGTDAVGHDSSTEIHKVKKNNPKKNTKSRPEPIPGGDPRGNVDLVVCSQNLKLFGLPPRSAGHDPKKLQDKHESKVRGLVTRFMSVGCDVIAVQEVMAQNESAAEAVLSQLALELRKRTNRVFKVVVAPPTEGQMTNGFLVALDRATYQQSLTYGRVELPRISKKQRPRLFTRPPFELQISVQARDSDVVKPISIVNFHFKSKRGGRDDPTGMEWETYRMEMSEALRQVAELRHKNSFASGESLLLLLGDRNSNFDVASARILEGSLALSSFYENGPCRMSKRGLPLCAADKELPRKLFSVITSNQSLQALPGTFNYKGDYSWLDDILLPAESLRFAWRTAFSEGDYESGVVSTPPDVSDHSMVYVKLNW